MQVNDGLVFVLNDPFEFVDGAFVFGISGLVHLQLHRALLGLLASNLDLSVFVSHQLVEFFLILIVLVGINQRSLLLLIVLDDDLGLAALIL